MAIQKEFILRYRAPGHVRFQVPARVCETTMRSRLDTELSAIQGIRNVRFYIKQCKLSIRFDENLCAFNVLAKRLFGLLAEVEKDLISGLALPTPSHRASGWRQKIGSKLKNLTAYQWLKSKYTDAKETVQAAKIVTKIGMKHPQAFMRDPESAIINFFNDILVLYLIKTHWKRITQVWIPNPLKYRYEWLVIFYLFFLLMRSRRLKT